MQWRCHLMAGTKPCGSATSGGHQATGDHRERNMWMLLGVEVPLDGGHQAVWRCHLMADTKPGGSVTRRRTPSRVEVPLDGGHQAVPTTAAGRCTHTCTRERTRVYPSALRRTAAVTIRRVPLDGGHQAGWRCHFGRARSHRGSQRKKSEDAT